MKRQSFEDRFWSKVRKTEGCWEWTAGTYRKGYGKFSVARSTNAQAHRVSWQMGSGPIPDGLFVCHHCDNPSCVRPDHLFLGTNRDNVRDCVQKGRLNWRPWQSASAAAKRNRTHCRKGHAYNEENIYRQVDGSRECKTCHRECVARYEHNRKRSIPA
jgi:hypothetical protein